MFVWTLNQVGSFDKNYNYMQDYINTTKKYNCEIIKMTGKRKNLSLSVFTSKEDAESTKEQYSTIFYHTLILCHI